MTAAEKTPQVVLAAVALPRIVFVLGKGGVGRSTVSAALGLALAARGERVLVLQWAVADAIGPWFGRAPAGATPVEVSPRLSVANFSLEDGMRSYFVDHLRLGFVFRRVIHADPVWRLIRVAPGISEIFFLGELWWLLELAAKEQGLSFDRIVVDAPATGHGASLLDVPSTLSAMGASGLLAVEVRRVVDLMADPLRTGAIAVALPEPLVVAETLELVPRVTARLGRPPLAVLVNRSAAELVSEPMPADALTGLSPLARATLMDLEAELRARAVLEGDLGATLLHGTARGTASLPELLGLSPLDVVRGLAARIGGA